MSASADPEFPAFVVARTVDAVYAGDGAAMPENTPVASVGLPFKGQMEQCLAWFTTTETADAFMQASRIKGCSVALNSATEAVAFLEKRSFFGVALNPRGVGDLPSVYPYGHFLDLFRKLAANEPFPILIPLEEGRKGMLKQPIEGGNLVPLFTGGFAPRAFFLNRGATSDCDVSVFRDWPDFEPLLRTIVGTPAAFQISGFVLNPTGADLRQYPSLTPSELLARLAQARA